MNYLQKVKQKVSSSLNQVDEGETESTKPTEFNDIVAMNALYRPGPMAQIEVYVRRKNKEEQVVYPHPHLEKILRDTYGVIVYQRADYVDCG